MPEHEIAKHTKAIYTEWRNPAHGWKHKLSEIGIEIFIIVFAITLSLFVERWRENAHERTLEKQFLTGLKKDLQTDLSQLREDSLSYIDLKKGWSYYYNVGKGVQPPQEDSLRNYQWTLFNNTTFYPSNSRFQALQSSGAFGVIEDDSLQNKILDLYQNQIPALRLSTDMFAKIKNEQLVPYLFIHLQMNNDTAENLADVVKQQQFQNYMTYRFTVKEVIDRYHSNLQQSRIIIHMIDEQYHLQ